MPVDIPPDLLIAAPIVLLACTVLGLSGFGAALVAVPLLAWQWPLTWVVPQVLLLDVPASLFHTGLNLQTVVWRELPRLLPSLVAGTVLGLWVHRWTQSVQSMQWLTLALGGYVFLVGVRGLLQWSNTRPAPNPAAHAAGLLIGTVETLFGTAGPLVVAWLNRRISDPQALRATVPMCIALAATMVIVAHLLVSAPSTPSPWKTALVLLPLAMLGVAAGHRLAHQLPKQRLQQAVFSTLMLSGCAMVAGSLRRAMA
jgi:uncharacterized protein